MEKSSGTKTFNILVSCIRGRERSAAMEVEELVGNTLGDQSVEVELTGIDSLVSVKTSLEPRDAIEKLRSLLKEDPWRFQYTLKYTPLDLVVPSKIDLITEASKTLVSRISRDETFRVTCNRRHTRLHCTEVVRSVAAMIDRKVDLDHPDKVVQIEIVGELTGLTVLSRRDVFSLGRSSE